MLKKLKRKRGFTLIEVTIVILIIAIVSSVGLASFSGYKQKALEKQVRAECLGVLNAAQAALDEYRTFHEQEFAEYVESRSVQLYEKDAGRYFDLGQGSGKSNRGMLGQINEITFQHIQGNGGKSPDPPPETYVDNYVAEKILEYLDSESSVSDDEKRFKFGVYTGEYFGKKSSRQSITQYLSTTSSKTEAAVNVYYNSYGNVFLVEWGHDGILCTITAGGITVEENGSPYWST